MPVMFNAGKVLFAPSGKVAMHEDCCCVEGNCELCLTGNALDEYALDLAGVTALCCTAAAGWNATYTIVKGGSIELSLNVGCNPGMGVSCNGECGGFQFAVALGAPKCRWNRTITDVSCLTPGPGNTGITALVFDVWLLQSPDDNKYYWYCTIGASYTQATVCSAGVAHFLSAGTETKPDCLDLDVTLNYLCHVWSSGPTRVADFSGATVTIRNP